MDMVIQTLEFRQLAGRAVGGIGTVQFLYCTTDPYMVHFSFDHVAFRFSRDLLADGITDRFGDSDSDEAAGSVVVQPTRDGVEITFRATEGEVTCLFDRDDLIDAMDETWKVMEQGREVDSWLAHQFPEVA